MLNHRAVTAFRRNVKKWMGYPEFESLYPWYDSQWLSSYKAATKYIDRKCPERKDEFVDSMRVFETPKTFKPVRLPALFNHAELEELRAIVGELQTKDVEKGEWEYFGRYVVHNHPYFVNLQRKLTSLVSMRVGEEVEPSYNFLSLYKTMGVCPVHRDAMSAKWTLDICIDQSEGWPIHFSEVRPFLETFHVEPGEWQRQIKSRFHFEPQVLSPGDGIIFSGSSQWHYRNAITSAKGRHPFCHLVFFHFIPKGTKSLCSPPLWEDHFKIPRLKRCAPYTEDLL